MELERESQQRHGSSAIGWISVADVFLFSVVIMAAVAVFTQSNLIRTETESEELTQENQTLHEHLEKQTKKLDAVIRAVEELSDQHASLSAEVKGLRTIVASLLGEVKQAGIERATLRRNLQEQHASLLATEDRLKTLESTAEELHRKLADATATWGQVVRMNRWLKEEVDRLKTDLDTVRKELRDLSEKWGREKRIRKEIVGLKGDLRRVAILFDSSGSMRNVTDKGTQADADAEPKEKRWEHARRVVETWVNDLEVDQCVLILFNNTVRTFPGDGSLLNVSGAKGEDGRKQLSKQLDNLQPSGGTNTLDALRKAYEYEQIDTIILFTDGAPSQDQSGKFDPELAEQIYALCKQHQQKRLSANKDGIPINTVGLVDYFDPELGGFLKEVARLTGGAYLGR